MDFKVAGTRRGITALQMDIKISGISKDLMKQALEQAREGRLFILDKMAEVINAPAQNISAYAPKIMTINVETDKIGLIIGPGGKTVRSIIEKSGAEVNIDDNGTITLSSKDEGAVKKAYDMICTMTEEVEVGKTYEGRVKRIMDFGAFIEILPGKEGLCHISQLDHKRVNKVTDVLKVGDTVTVKVRDIDAQGRINLSRKEVLPRTHHSRYHERPR
jgi:polyribonucleotide nucleotidyltransferase